jgi:hypothetical protein
MLVYLNRLTYEITVPSYGLCVQCDLFFATTKKHAFHECWTHINKLNSCESHHKQVRVFWVCFGALHLTFMARQDLKNLQLRNGIRRRLSNFCTRDACTATRCHRARGRKKNSTFFLITRQEKCMTKGKTILFL